MAKKQTTKKTVETIKHDEATRKDIPTAEYQSVLQKEEETPVRHAYFLGANYPYSALKTTAQGRDQRRSLGHAPQRHLPPVRQTEVRPDCGEGHQPPRG
jgi:hypothetical protein